MEPLGTYDKDSFDQFKAWFTAYTNKTPDKPFLCDKEENPLALWFFYATYNTSVVTLMDYWYYYDENLDKQTVKYTKWQKNIRKWIHWIKLYGGSINKEYTTKNVFDILFPHDVAERNRTLTIHTRVISER